MRITETDGENRNPSEIPSERFLAIELLGEGGFGQVFRAQDLKHNTTVALKLLPKMSAEALYRLKREYRIIQPMAHPNVVRVLDLVATQNNQALMTMELLDGEHLDTHLLAGDRDSGHSARIADAFEQLEQGLRYIHRHGVVHRDLKPSNVMVTKGGRVVLLDFGFAKMVDDWAQKSASVLGSAGYAARELLSGENADSAADWYSAGVMLQEAITGQRARRPLPELPEGVTAPLTRLLHDDPTQRGGAAELREACRVLSGDQRSVESEKEHAGRSDFVGRELEIKQLHSIFSKEFGESSVAGAWIEGPSGIGKTRLAQEFLTQRPTVNIVLQARCNPSETLAFGILDPLVDTLTEYLVSSGIRPSISRATRHLGYLLELFPVLSRAPGFSQPSVAETTVNNAQRRTRGMNSLGRLLRELSEDEPLIIWLDDAQWGSTGDIALLENVLVGDYRPNVFLLITSREETSDEIAEQTAIREARRNLDRFTSRPGFRITRIELQPLRRDAARTLTTLLLEQTTDSLITRVDPDEKIDAEKIDQYVETCDGNPLLLEQLGWYLRTQPNVSFARPNQWLLDRFEAISAQDQYLVRILAVCGHPLSEDSLRRLGAKVSGQLAQLCHEGWLRTRTYKGERCFDIYHDIVRHRIAETLENNEVESLHLSIATVLAATQTGNAPELVNHYIAANQNETAAQLALVGASEATFRLAWGQAASLYYHAYQLHTTSPDLQLLENCANCLRLDSRQVEAAEVLREASDLARTKGDIALATKLLMDCAISYMQGGDIRRGRQTLRDCASDLQVKLHTNLLPILLPRMTMAVRTPRISSHLQRSSASVTETLGQLTYSLTHVDVNVAHGVLMQWIKAAKNSGDHVGLGRALLIEATVHGYISGPLRQSGRRLFVDAWKLLPHNSEERATALAHLAQLAFGDGDWERTWRRTILAEKIHQKIGSQWYGYAWFYLSYNMAASAMLGKLAYMVERLPDLAAEARSRNDLLSQSFYDGALSAYGWLAMDKPAHVLNATAQLDDQLSAQDFTSHTFYEVIGRVPAMHYSEQYEDAWEYMLEKWPKLLDAGFSAIKSQFLLLTINYCNAAAGVVTHRELFDQSTQEKAEEVLLEQVKILSKYPVPAGRPFADQYQAALLLSRGKIADAIDKLSLAAAGFRKYKMRLHAAAADRRIAQLRNDDSALEAATREFRAENVLLPDAMQRAYLPL